MKLIIIIFIALSSFSTFAQDISRGGTLIFTIDWERVFDTLTINESTKVSHCRQMYKNLYETSNLLNELLDNGEITQEDANSFLSIQASQEEIADLSCRRTLGKRKAKRLKQNILEKRRLL